ncbi:(d)CMP kinase [Alkalibacter saccharofermentans]|uniref:Cytidylate kinase n=1 Tax=Alkalibacter saccharofermentans DSM 14828 TaxID=1120975 RepID=A0A1M4Z5J6_9FIRM|nr:(d)CMP kinase [Alkalibacter saccharofermentans]SHF13329.1 cytidylate kinase [Alkalibacter saccharofermentans DSM 14828]
MKIAVDGPAGAGKSTISKILAKKLGINYLDTGAMYRAATYKTIKESIDPENEEAVVKAVENSDIYFKDNEIYLDGENVKIQIRSPQVNRLVSVISKIDEIRKIMVAKQKKISESSDVIMDGRDIGTVVMPDADYKFYLDASIEIRAKRRFEEMDDKSAMMSFESLKKEIAKRDEEDKNRKTGPLKVAEDAVVIDTSGLEIDQVVELMAKKIKGE